ncbi:MAG: hypothetical protein ACP5UV_00540 [Thermoplasmata archaeon]
MRKEIESFGYCKYALKRNGTDGEKIEYVRFNRVRMIKYGGFYLNKIHQFNMTKTSKTSATEEYKKMIKPDVAALASIRKECESENMEEYSKKIVNRLVENPATFNNLNIELSISILFGIIFKIVYRFTEDLFFKIKSMLHSLMYHSRVIVLIRDFCAARKNWS